MKLTLCGSTRFRSEFEQWTMSLTLAGHLVYSLGMFGREASDEGKGDNILVSDADKVTLDLVHLNKILNSDAIVVLNITGYLGFSTKREVEWAIMLGRPVYSVALMRNARAAGELLVRP